MRRRNPALSMSSPVFAAFARQTIGARAPDGAADALLARRRAALLCWASLAVLVLGLGACGPRAPAASVAAPVAANALESQPATEPLRVVLAEAIVISTDASKGLLSLRQSPQAEMGWPEMTIAYRAMGSALSGLNPGDRIAFDLELGGGEGGFVLATRKL
jgi:Cu/Ag efflux protein CusF